MKNLLSVLLLLLVSISLKAQYNTISWQKEPIVIDGASFDWGTSFRYFDSKTRIRYNISNDSSYIYFCFQPVDEFVKGQILRAGIVTEFYPKTKPKRKAVLKYPAAMEKPDGTQTMSTDNNFESFFQSFQMFNNTYEAEGFEKSNGKQPIENADGISVKFDRETNGLLCYELKIPIEELYGKNYDLSNIAEDDLTVKLKINAVTVKTKKKDDGSDAGNYGSNSMYSGRYGYNQNQHQGQYNSFTIQGKTLVYKVKIADKPE